MHVDVIRGRFKVVFVHCFFVIYGCGYFQMNLYAHQTCLHLCGFKQHSNIQACINIVSMPMIGRCINNYYWLNTRVMLEILGSARWGCMILPLNHKVYPLTTLKTMICICLLCQFKTRSPSFQTHCSIILIACDLYPIT